MPVILGVFILIFLVCYLLGYEYEMRWKTFKNKY